MRRRRVLATIAVGLACTVLLTLFFEFLATPGARALAICLCLWTSLASYTLLLTHRDGAGPWSPVPVLGTLLVLAFMVRDPALFAAPAAVGLWLVSSLSRPRLRLAVALVVDAVLVGSGAALAWLMAATAGAGWAWGIWLFYLVQALGHVDLRPYPAAAERTVRKARFERARMRVQEVLAKSGEF